MLDAFQSAAINIAHRSINALVPLHEFFPCIESFLDTSVKRSIEQAKGNNGLQVPFDIQILQTLFLIRYVDIIKPNVDNLVTLSIDQVDADRIVLKQHIDEALVRLEKENLISRNGDLYFFLTNEEREVSREIKSIEISSHAETDLLATIIFEDILKGKTKHKYLPYKRDYAFNRICDDKPWGKKLEHDLTLEIISPMHDQYVVLNVGQYTMHSLNTEGTVLVRLDNDQNLFTDIRTFIQTEKYIKDKSDAAASTSLKQILRDRADENRERKNRLISKVDDLIQGADFYTLGKSYTPKVSGNSTRVIESMLEHVIQNIFSKYSYLSQAHDDPVKEIKQILLSDNISQQQLLDFAQKTPHDVKEIVTYIQLKTATHKTVVLNELVSHFSKRPYGWPEFQVVVLIANIFMAGTIQLLHEKDWLPPKDAIPFLTKTSQWKHVQILEKPALSSGDLKKAQQLGKDLFGTLAPDGQDKISDYIKSGLNQWTVPLEKYRTLANTGNYPGKKEIESCLKITDIILDIQDAYEVIKAFIQNKEDLLDAQEDFLDLKDFYTHQQGYWESLLAAMLRFKTNEVEINKDAGAKKAFNKLSQIVTSQRPYNELKNVSELISTVERINTQKVQAHQVAVINEIDEKVACLVDLLDENSADDDFRNKILYPLQTCKKKIADENSIPQIAYSVKEVQEKYESVLDAIEEAFRPDDDVKEIKNIKLSNLNKKPYLDKEEDVEAFVDRVKNELLEAVRKQFRVRVQ